MNANVSEKIKLIDDKFLRSELPEFNVGDYVKMKVKVQEADKVRMHPFEGTVIRKTGRGLKGTFTVRKVSFGEGVERIFPLHSPVIDSIKIVNRGVVRKAKLYYLKRAIGKKGRVQRENVVSVQDNAPVPAEVQ